MLSKKTEPLLGIREGVFTSQLRKYYEIIRVAKRKKIGNKSCLEQSLCSDLLTPLSIQYTHNILWEKKVSEKFTIRAIVDGR